MPEIIRVPVTAKGYVAGKKRRYNISVDMETYERLIQHCRPRESLNSLIGRLLDDIEQQRRRA
jgi:predicted CopG family antitoxin